MKSFKKVAVTILAAVMMLLISTTVFAADSPVKTSFNASLTKKTVTYTGKKQQPKVVVKNEAGKTIKAKYYTVKVKTCNPDPSATLSKNQDTSSVPLYPSCIPGKDNPTHRSKSQKGIFSSTQRQRSASPS